MRFIVFLTTVLLFISSCIEKREAPKIDYNHTETDSLTIEDAISDTTKTIIATLPLSFDSTNVLIQPSGLVNIKNIKSTDIYNSISSLPDKKSRGKEPEFHSNGIYGDELSGKMSNVYFDDLTTNTQVLLTNSLISIHRIVYLREIAKKTGKDYLIYFVYDKDTNRDGELDSNDILSLYISKLDGKDFTKITLGSHELLNTKLISLANRYYFTTIEDINKDGHLNKEDKYHYYYIDFSADSYKIVEYDPTVIR